MTYVQHNPQEKVSKKDDIEGKFVIPCSIGRLKYVNALIDQGSDVNVMPMSFYNRLSNEKPVGTDIRFSLANHSYIYPLGIVEDVLIDIVGYVYPVDFVILDIKEDENKPFILGTSFLTMAKAVIRFDKWTITLTSGKNKIDFVKIPEFPSTKSREENERRTSIHTPLNVSRLIFGVWGGMIKVHQRKKWDSTNGEVIFDENSLKNPEAKRQFSRPLDSYSFDNFAEIVAVLLEGKQKSSTITINKGLIQAIPTLLPPQPIREATKASNLQRIPPGVQGRSHFTYFLYLIVQITNPIFLDYCVTLGFGSMGGLDLACPINRSPCHGGIQWELGRITNSLPGVGTDRSPHQSLDTLKA
ncbi:retrovirus-related pol polyprotein from transposon TNT 1-94 [Tanacetum coccineum]